MEKIIHYNVFIPRHGNDFADGKTMIANALTFRYWETIDGQRTLINATFVIELSTNNVSDLIYKPYSDEFINSDSPWEADFTNGLIDDAKSRLNMGDNFLFEESIDSSYMNDLELFTPSIKREIIRGCEISPIMINNEKRIYQAVIDYLKNQ